MLIWLCLNLMAMMDGMMDLSCSKWEIYHGGMTALEVLQGIQSLYVLSPFIQFQVQTLTILRRGDSTVCVLEVSCAYSFFAKSGFQV